MSNHREVSRSNYAIRGERATTNEITVGSLQRIADAVEKMGTSHSAERDRLSMEKSAYVAKSQTWKHSALERISRSALCVVSSPN